MNHDSLNIKSRQWCLSIAFPLFLYDEKKEGGALSQRQKTFFQFKYLIYNKLSSSSTSPSTLGPFCLSGSLLSFTIYISGRHTFLYLFLAFLWTVPSYYVIYCSPNYLEFKLNWIHSMGLNLDRKFLARLSPFGKFSLIQITFNELQLNEEEE